MNHFGMISEINVNIYEKAQTICPTLTKVNNISILLKKNPVRISNSNKFLFAHKIPNWIHSTEV